MAADVVDQGLEKIAQAHAFETFLFVWNPFPDRNISWYPIPVFEYGSIDKVIKFLLLVGK
jgi:hypothetical protein